MGQKNTLVGSVQAYAEQAVKNNRTVVSATLASLVGTSAGYPLDSLKSRLQANRTPITLASLAKKVWREEGFAGFYRGIWIPLITISAVRAVSFSIYTRTKDILHDNNMLNRGTLFDVSSAGGLGGILSGAVISVGSAPFELVKVRRQLEYSIAEQRGIAIIKPPNTLDAVADIVRRSGVTGLYTGFRLHFVRDTLGTGLYFAEYEAFRHVLGRRPSGVQGPQPSWLPFHIPESTLPFLCGSVAGVTAWAIIYPLDVAKTKLQQRALSGGHYRSAFETLTRLVRGPDPNNPKPVVSGIARLYRGLGVSGCRSVITHGVLWTLFDYAGSYIDSIPDRSRPPLIS
ncbi:hypothetical protein BS47DRAFT_638387 [Hydnum rufescens UP504]|uniref:Mitochondrial carrier n=1 Tax=Hydnum rufescens UP504 TaxID=1448309 RepID=A0A9P6BBS5_9AGAM|nr:hypothetical protein BS47DRAFT_638387 [Hydnum rufescens UP504]